MVSVQDQVRSNHLFVIEGCLFVFDEVAQFIGELVLQSSLNVHLRSVTATNEELGPILPDLIGVELLSNHLLRNRSHILNHRRILKSVRHLLAILKYLIINLLFIPN